MQVFQLCMAIQLCTPVLRSVAPTIVHTAHYEGKYKRKSIFGTKKCIICNYTPPDGEAVSLQLYSCKFIWGEGLTPPSCSVRTEIFPPDRNSRTFGGVVRIISRLAPPPPTPPHPPPLRFPSVNERECGATGGAPRVLRVGARGPGGIQSVAKRTSCCITPCCGQRYVDRFYTPTPGFGPLQHPPPAQTLIFRKCYEP